MITIVVLLSVVGLGTAYVVTQDNKTEPPNLPNPAEGVAESESESASITDVELQPLEHSLDEFDSLWLVVNDRFHLTISLMT